ncbi:MAG: DUF1553 domain-containing protein [Gemmataceae bacterium]|nr:DUF1553 domain-containing protein [Gemmataceae bacterium]
MIHLCLHSALPALLALAGLPGQAAAGPTYLSIHPPAVQLRGARAEQQLVVSEHARGSPVHDRTRVTRFTSSNPAVAVVSADGKVRPGGNGVATITARAGSLEATVSVRVAGLDCPDPVAFGTDVIPALTRAGCNAGSCHGTPTGKNGFKLSLRGYLPEQDHDSLTRDMHGRRLDLIRPEQSLLLLKAAAVIPHEGGARFRPDSPLYRLLRDWIAEGARLSPTPKVARLEVFPAERVLHAPAGEQQLAVTAVFADGSRRDITGLARFSVNDPSLADVSADGLVRSQKMGEVSVLVSYLTEVATTRLTFLRDVPGFVWKAPPERNYIDKHVFAKLKLLRIQPSALCTDEEFVRRVYLDVCGILPTPEETSRFLAAPLTLPSPPSEGGEGRVRGAPDKRARLIDELLERPEYADCWALKWVDRLGCNNRFVGQRGAYSYRQWIWEHVNANVPFDRFVRSLITASGPNYSEPPASFYRRIRNPETRVEAVSHLFLGVRIGCARCHNHPAERWTQDDYYGLAAFFSRVRYRNGPFFLGIYNKEETVWLDREGEVVHPRTGQAVKPRLLGGPEVKIVEGRDRREALARWVTSPTNPFFARVTVNRLWYHLLGRGIVDPVDDFRESNPPCNPQLLDALAKDFVAHGFDVKHTLRTILNSSTYQLSSATNTFNKDDEVYFSHYRVRQLPAEMLLDAICQVTGVPEPFKGVPLGTRAAQLPDGELFHPFLKAFGKPARAIECECEREGDSTLEQALLLEGGRLIQEKLRADGGRVARLAASKATPEAIAEELFLAALCRPPTAEERAVVVRRLRAGDRRQALEDVLWVLLNHREFLFQH